MYYEYQHEQNLVVSTAEMELGFSTSTGMLTLLRRPNQANILNIGSIGMSVDVQLADGWVSETHFPRYLSHHGREVDGVTELTINIGLGFLRISDSLQITGTLIRRSVAVTNSGGNEARVHWVRLSWPYARVGSYSEARFEAPSNSFRPRLDIAAVSKLRRGALPTQAIAPAIRRGRLFENAPDRGPGLLALHSTSESDNLLCWYWSKSQSAWPDIDGNDLALTVGHELEIAGWLAPDATLSGGTQYCMLVHGNWYDAMHAFHNTWPVLGVQTLPDVPDWVCAANIYETHVGLWGGFAKFSQELARLRDLGFDTINLMPIWRYNNLSGQPWDMNWQASGSPYAIEDFEQLEPSLGTAEEFKALVEQAHALGMRILCDLVVQGCSRTARYVQERPGWFCRDERGRLVSSHGWNDTYSFDWANPEVQDFYVDWTTRFAQTYQIDGWRVDAPHRKEPNWDRRLERMAASTSFGVLTIVERMRQALRQINPQAALLCELYGPLFPINHDFAYDYLAHLMFFHAGLGVLSPYELGEWLEDHFLALPKGSIRVCFTETHDTRDVNPIADAVRGSRLARLLLTGMVGCGFVPMLWTGQEVGQEAWLKQLFSIRANYPILRHGKQLFNVMPCDMPSVWSVLRVWHEERLAVVLNMGPHRRTATLSMPVDRMHMAEGDYHLFDLVRGQAVEYAGRNTWRRDDLLNLTLILEPFDSLLLHIRAGAPPQPEPAKAEPIAAAAPAITSRRRNR
ncbi:MAG: hypothetical protein LCH85_14895 [Chloroflexi bacterium]|nr:hypothetical protein [Chloroflexota bacterium]